MTEEKRRPGRPPGSKNRKNTKPETKKTGNREKKKETKEIRIGSRVRDEIWSIIIMAVGAFLIIALQTGAAGTVGKLLHDFFLGCFGFTGYILPYYLIVYGILLFVNKAAHISARTSIYIFMIFLMIALLNSVRFIDPDTFEFSGKYMAGLFNDGILLKNGGFVGMILGIFIEKAIGKPGLIILASAVIVVFLLLALNTPVSQFFERLKLRKLEKQHENEKRAEMDENGTHKEEKDDDLLHHLPKKKKDDFDINISAETEKYRKALRSETSGHSARMSDGQINIMNYMKDDALFEDNTSSEERSKNGNIRYGLEPSADGKVPYSAAAKVAEAEERASETKIVSRNINGQENAAENSTKLTNKEAGSAMLTKDEINLSAAGADYVFPPVDLLKKGKAPLNSGNADASLREKAVKLEETLKNFNVDAHVINVTQGPSVTQYEIQPSVGVKVASIVKLADDIALNLEAKSIRIEAPIPGKAAVGIEIENETRNMVTLREVIDSEKFRKTRSKISFAVGRDIYGNEIIGDIKEMTHLLIAGSTGSGKSVCINSIIMSILYKARPEEVKLVLIDPKVVELGNYNGIPHLLIPVVTDTSKAAAALNWAVAEMTERYKKFAETSVRDLESYNKKMEKEGSGEKIMPQIVIIIDELADLMMAAPSQVEESICRLAQMARAAGMHLIIATQRPSVDVVTGLIKANIPSRISFKVFSQVDSRTILDCAGAEKLVGKGDMLYAPIGQDKIRVQGVFVSDEEVNAVIDFVKKNTGEAEYSGEVINSIENSTASRNETEDDDDELLSDAIETVVKSGQASVSMLQRRFRIGYNRAARMIDSMEQRGIIGPPDGSRPRQVYMTEDELYAVDEDEKADIVNTEVKE